MFVRWFRLALMELGFKPPLISDDYSFVPAWCRWCGADVIVIRPGDFRCKRCEN